MFTSLRRVHSTSVTAVPTVSDISTTSVVQYTPLPKHKPLSPTCPESLSAVGVDCCAQQQVGVMPAPAPCIKLEREEKPFQTMKFISAETDV